ncbi:Hint domain-containing protein [Azospirillum doebereinerae]|nr:Hint domain-containing protein [Azospirillum doebereinerae]MCG5244218.1 Hint domain-containing protein [Azospirillum doebereinerae]
MAPLPDATCILRGALIRAMSGDVPVETLKIGDFVQSAITGEFRPIRWIGRRTLSGSALDTERLRKVHLPVRIARDAFGPAVPERDLHISPGHAIILGEHGVSARLLMNGTSIAQVEAMASIAYFHIELDTHDSVFANGLPIETYLESDNRHAYDNAAEYEALYPGDDPRVQVPCVKIDIPLALLELIRSKLNERAALLRVAETA